MFFKDIVHFGKTSIITAYIRDCVLYRFSKAAFTQLYFILVAIFSTILCFAINKKSEIKFNILAVTTISILRFVYFD